MNGVNKRLLLSADSSNADCPQKNQSATFRDRCGDADQIPGGLPL
jgi:hypothetical protein